jgi:hypothetical protein
MFSVFPWNGEHRLTFALAALLVSIILIRSPDELFIK